MTALSDEIAWQILQALAENGEAVVVWDIDEGVFDHTTGTATGTTGEDYPGTGLFHAFKSDEIDGTRITAKDQRCIIAADGLGYVPKRGDQIDDAAGTTWSIFDEISVYKINGVHVAYACPARIR